MVGSSGRRPPSRTAVCQYPQLCGACSAQLRVFEAADGRVVTIEVKAAASVGPGDTRGLAVLRDELGDRFVQGVVLAAVDRTVPLGDRITAAPVSTLWA